MATIASQLAPVRSFVFENVSWEYYDRTLRELDAARQHARVTYDDGRMEIAALGGMHHAVHTAGRR